VLKISFFFYLKVMKQSEWGLIDVIVNNERALI